MKKDIKKETTDWFKSLFWAIVIAVFVRIFFVGNFKIPTTSMVPTLMVGDRLISNDIIYKIRKPQRGEVVIFKHIKENHTTDYVKRAIALPGERVLIKEGKIYINGKEVTEPRISCRYYYSDGYYGVVKETEVPPRSYYVLGDNSINSSDSRYWGFVAEKDLVGKALFIYWPPWRMGFIR